MPRAVQLEVNRNRSTLLDFVVHWLRGISKVKKQWAEILVAESTAAGINELWIGDCISVSAFKGVLRSDEETICAGCLIGTGSSLSPRHRGLYPGDVT